MDLFPADDQPIIIEQGRTGDCYLLACLDCIIKTGPDGRQKIKSLFTEIRDPDTDELTVQIKIKQTADSAHLAIQLPKAQNKFIYSEEGGYDVFTFPHQRLAEIDNDRVGAQSNCLAVKILERLSAYYFAHNWLTSSISAHNGNDRYAGDQASQFVGKLLDVSVKNTRDIRRIVKLKTICPEKVAYIEMDYGRQNAGVVHGRHALRVDKITEDPRAPGGYVFELINPWRNQGPAEKYHLLDPLKPPRHRPIFATFSLKPEFDALLEDALEYSVSINTGKYVFEHADLVDMLLAVKRNGIQFRPVNFERYVTMHQQIPQLATLFAVLDTRVEQQQMVSCILLYGIKIDFVKRLLKQVPNAKLARALIQHEKEAASAALDELADIAYNEKDQAIYKFLVEKNYPFARYFEQRRAMPQPFLLPIAIVLAINSNPIPNKVCDFLRAVDSDMSDALLDGMLNQLQLTTPRDLFVALHRINHVNGRLAKDLLVGLSKRFSQLFFDSTYDRLVRDILSENDSEFKTWFVDTSGVKQQERIEQAITQINALIVSIAQAKNDGEVDYYIQQSQDQLHHMQSALAPIMGGAPVSPELMQLYESKLIEINTKATSRKRTLAEVELQQRADQKKAEIAQAQAQALVDRKLYEIESIEDQFDTLTVVNQVDQTFYELRNKLDAIRSDSLLQQAMATANRAQEVSQALSSKTERLALGVTRQKARIVQAHDIIGRKLYEIESIPDRFITLTAVHHIDQTLDVLRNKLAVIRSDSSLQQAMAIVNRTQEVSQALSRKAQWLEQGATAQKARVAEADAIINRILHQINGIQDQFDTFTATDQIDRTFHVLQKQLEAIRLNSLLTQAVATVNRGQEVIQALLSKARRLEQGVTTQKAKIDAANRFIFDFTQGLRTDTFNWPLAFDTLDEVDACEQTFIRQLNNSIFNNPHLQMQHQQLGYQAFHPDILRAGNEQLANIVKTGALRKIAVYSELIRNLPFDFSGCHTLSELESRRQGYVEQLQAMPAREERIRDAHQQLGYYQVLEPNLASAITLKIQAINSLASQCRTQIEEQMAQQEQRRQDCIKTITEYSDSLYTFGESLSFAQNKEIADINRNVARFINQTEAKVREQKLIDALDGLDELRVQTYRQQMDDARRACLTRINTKAACARDARDMLARVHFIDCLNKIEGKVNQFEGEDINKKKQITRLTRALFDSLKGAKDDFWAGKINATDFKTRCKTAIDDKITRATLATHRGFKPVWDVIVSVVLSLCSLTIANFKYKRWPWELVKSNTDSTNKLLNMEEAVNQVP